MRKLMLVFCIMVSIFSVQAQPHGYTTVADIAKFKDQFATIAKKTESIKSDFVQEKNLSMLSEKIVSKGKFWFKKDNLLRMEYNTPYEYLMILNNDNMFIKEGQKENKVSLKANKIFQQINRIIIGCVQGTALSNPDFKTNIFENGSTYIVELSPLAKGLKEFFKTIQVVIDKKDYSVTDINMYENSGDNTTIHFLNRAFNIVIPDALFTIK